MFDAAMDVIDQGVNKRPGAIMVYLEPWHADVFTFLRMKRVRQSSETAARRLFYGLFVNDLLSVCNKCLPSTSLLILTTP